MVIICILLWAYWVIMLLRILSSWFPAPGQGPLRQLMEVVYSVTEPVLRPLRSIIKPVRLGMVGLDLSPIIVFVVITVLQRIFC
ncbi:MAG: YggT family protein [Actinobacteria bacterium]|nr:MAG: YggT family protein [Actinomycetota bacterium]